jgi:MFS family permease
MLITGFILEHSDWGATFLIVLPIAVISLIVGQSIIPTSRDPEAGKLDLPGAVLSTAGLSALVYGLIEAPHHGWTSVETIGLIVAGLALIGAFAAWELKTAHPMLDVRLFELPAFRISALTLTLVFFVLMGLFFSVAQLFQLVMGYGSFEASLRMAPIPLFMMFASPLSPALVERLGKRRVVSLGLFIVAAGILVLAMLPDSPSYWHVLAGMAIMSVGMAMTMSPTTDLLMSAVPRTKAGMGSATNDTTRELGGSLGVAVLGSIIASTFAGNLGSAVNGLSETQRSMAESSLAGAFTVAQQVGGEQGAALLASAQSAWMSGLSLAMFIGAAIVAVSAAIAFVAMPDKAHDEVEEFVREEEGGELLAAGAAD